MAVTVEEFLGAMSRHLPECGIALSVDPLLDEVVEVHRDGVVAAFRLSGTLLGYDLELFTGLLTDHIEYALDGGITSGSQTPELR